MSNAIERRDEYFNAQLAVDERISMRPSLWETLRKTVKGKAVATGATALLAVGCGPGFVEGAAPEDAECVVEYAEMSDNATAMVYRALGELSLPSSVIEEKIDTHSLAVAANKHMSGGEHLVAGDAFELCADGEEVVLVTEAVAKG